MVTKGKRRAALKAELSGGEAEGALKPAIGRKAYHVSLQDTAIPWRWRGRPSLQRMDAEKGAGSRKGEGCPEIS